MARRFTIASQTLLLVVLVLATTSTKTSGQSAAASFDTCVGDCDGNGQVTVEELVAGVNIALDSQPLDTCPVFDSDDDGRVSVDEIVRAVGNALNRCPVKATPTFTATEAALTETPTATATLPPLPTPTETPIPTVPVHFCDLPGSVQTTANGLVVVPGGPATAPDLRFLHLPVGFCAHFFANIGNTRQLRFAPGGELFVASPSAPTTGGGRGGLAAIMVLADDDHDGVGDRPKTFLSGLPSTQGLLFTGGYLYYQRGMKIMRVPYASGDRTPSGSSEQVADITIYSSKLHWPKTLDVADDGTIYVGNGGDQGETCTSGHPFHGGILKLDGSPDATPVAKGFRNPISVRCSRGHNLCFAVELARDYSDTQGGREKLVPIRPGDDWGHPCCATKDVPYPDITPVPNCSTVASENNSFVIGHTPFDLDFETGQWPAPWNQRVYVPLHGAYGTWDGARVVAIELDPVTGQLLPGSDLGGESSGAMLDFATGWDDGLLLHGRPAVVAFASDGRLFLGNDNNGDIIWIAPLTL
jgi:glucose/arabinose dehydrogenase